MKKIFSLGLMLVALTLMNCSKEEIATEAPAVNGAAFELFASTEDGRTVNSGWNTQWDEGDQINVFHAEAGSTDYKNDTYDNKGTDDKADDTQHPFVVKDTDRGLFVGDLMGGALTEGTLYDWYLFYPYGSYITTPANTSSGYMTVGSQANAAQTQTGIDNLTHIAGENYPLYGQAKNVAAGEIPSVTMHNVSSLVEFAVTNTENEAIAISEIQFTSTEDIVGSYYIDFGGDKLGFTPSRTDYVSPTAKLSITEATIEAGATAKFYMAVKPHTVTAGDLTIKVTTDAGACTKTLEGITTTFKAGKVKTINFTYVAPAPAEAETWTRITSVGDLVSGGEYVILAYDKDKSIYLGYLPSTATDSAPQFPEATLFAGLPATVTGTPADNMRWVFTANNTNWIIKNANGNYLYGTNANNGARVGNTEDTWSIATHETNSAAFVFQNTSRSRYLGIFKDNPDWRTYTSWNASNYGSNGVGSQIYLYYKGTLAAKTPLATPDVTAAVQNTNEVVVSWKAVEGAANYTVTCGDKSTVTDKLTYTFTGLSYETDYTVEVVANPADVSTNVASEAGKSNTVKTGASVYVTIAEVLENAADGSAYAVKNAQVVALAYSNAVITDGTGHLFLYTIPSGCAIGDIYTLEFKLSEYGEVWQAKEITSAEKTGSAEVTYPTPIAYDGAKFDAITATNIADLAKAGTYIQFGATLSISGNYYNLNDTGSSYTPSLVKPAGDYSAFNGLPVTVTGYLMYFTSSKYPYIVATNIVPNDYITATPAGLSWEADSTEAKTVTVKSDKEGWTYTAPEWVSVTQNGSTLTIAPKAANTTEEALIGDLVLTHATNSTKTTTITLTQSAASGDDPSANEPIVLLSEDFSSASSGNNTSTSSGNTAWTGGSNFTTSGVYQAGGAIKLGAKSSAGSITTKQAFSLDKPVTVTFDVKGWSSIEGKIAITVGGVKKEVVYQETMYDSFGTYSVTFEAQAGKTSTVVIATTTKRAFMDNVVITTTK